MLTFHHPIILNFLDNAQLYQMNDLGVLVSRGSLYSVPTVLGCVVAEIGDLLVVYSRMDRNWLMVVNSMVLTVDDWFVFTSRIISAG